MAESGNGPENFVEFVVDVECLLEMRLDERASVHDGTGGSFPRNCVVCTADVLRRMRIMAQRSITRMQAYVIRFSA